MDTRRPTLRQAAGDVLRSIKHQRDIMGKYGGGSLREYLWTVASGARTYAEIGEALGLTRPQISRMTRTLHQLNYTGAPGLGLVDITFDLRKPSIKLVTLNAKGEALLRAEYEQFTGGRVEIREAA